MTHSITNRSKPYTRNRRNQSALTNQNFICLNCKLYVPSLPLLSGVQNRNHCPCCLWSRHLDSLRAGDRGSGCRAAMQPVGLTIKPSRNIYARERDGELMLVHSCTRCNKVITNRIAADDTIDSLLDLFVHSWAQGDAVQTKLDRLGLSLLRECDNDLVQRRLLGNHPVALLPRIDEAWEEGIS